MNLKEARQILKSRGYTIKEDADQGTKAIHAGFNKFTNIMQGGFDKIIDHLKDKIAVIYAKQLGVPLSDIYGSGHMKNIDLGFKLLGDRRVKAAHWSDDPRSIPELYNDMIKALNDYRAGKISLKESADEEITKGFEGIKNCILHGLGEGIMEHMKEKLVKLYAKQMHMSVQDLMNSPHMRNIELGMRLLGKDRIRAAHYDPDINSDKKLFNDMVTALKNYQNRG
jgi:hypothetical protein